MATAHDLLPLATETQLLTAEFHLAQRAAHEVSPLDQARAAASEALRLAQGMGRPLDEALAYRLLGQCALAGGDANAAVTHLRTAQAMQTERGAALEAARTRLALAEALVAVSGSESFPSQARTLLNETCVQFSASGAALDRLRAAQLSSAWNAQ
jgi:hypothetical protein